MFENLITRIKALRAKHLQDRFRLAHRYVQELRPWLQKTYTTLGVYHWTWDQVRYIRDLDFKWRRIRESCARKLGYQSPKYAWIELCRDEFHFDY